MALTTRAGKGDVLTWNEVDANFTGLADGSNMTCPVTLTEAVGSSALTLTGATQTASNPVLSMSQTWNAGAVAFTGVKLNVTNTASATGSLLMDLQVGGASQFKVDKDGAVDLSVLRTNAGSLGVWNGVNYWVYFSANGVQLNRLSPVSWSSGNTANSGADLFLTRKAAANLQLGAADAAAPVAQTLGAQSVVGGTLNTAAPNLTYRAPAGTGTGTGGAHIFQVATAGTSGSTQNTFVSALTIYQNTILGISGSFTVANLPAAGNAGRFTRVTDGTAALAWGATVTGGGTTPYLVWDNGTAWTVVGK